MTRAVRLMLGLPLFLVVFGCSSSSASGGAGGVAGSAGSGAGGAGNAAGTGGAAGDDGGSLPPPLGGDRPVVPTVPASYQPGTPVPLVIMLHGYGASGTLQEFVFQLKPLAEEFGFVLLAPDGTQETSGGKRRFWNATNFCCNFQGSTVDDVAYLDGLIEEAKQRFSIDLKRVYFVGHSNGGFMSHRMACDRAGKIAAIVSLAGAQWSDVTNCKPSEPVSVVQMHGTADDTILYAGESNGLYPSAEETVSDWRSLNGCADAAPETSTGDFVSSSPGAETTLSTWTNGCRSGSAVALWKMEGAPHVPGFEPAARRAIVEFLLAHPKP